MFEQDLGLGEGRDRLVVEGLMVENPVLFDRLEDLLDRILGKDGLPQLCQQGDRDLFELGRSLVDRMAWRVERHRVVTDEEDVGLTKGERKVSAASVEGGLVGGKRSEPAHLKFAAGKVAVGGNLVFDRLERHRPGDQLVVLGHLGRVDRLVEELALVRAALGQRVKGELKSANARRRQLREA